MAHVGEEPSGKRLYTPSEKDQFFRELDRVGSVTTAARSLGFKRSVCAQWARRRGLSSKRARHKGYEEFLRLRTEGVTRREAAVAVGVHLRTAKDWDRGIRKVGNSRIYPDGRKVDYTRGVTIVNFSAGGSETIPYPAVTVAQLEARVSARYLSLQERETIRDMVSSGSSMRAIAVALGRAPSTISREIARNNNPVHGGYQPYAAQRATVARRPRPKTRRFVESEPLRRYVQEKLLVRWSPEQISKTLIKEFPDDQEMRVAHETIYQSLYLQGRGGLRREITTALRTGRARRKTHRSTQKRTPRFVDPMIMISERPPEIEDRAVPGHWEGDLITGAFNRSAIATLVERTSRYVMLVHIQGEHSAEIVRDGLIATMGTLPEHLRGSLTWDQGVEMANHKSFSISTGMDVYFCDPASPWQRGSNENTNGLLRQYFPKGTDLSVHGPEDLERVAQELNGRPRKTLDWDTPAERLRDLLLPAK
ncbi:integrase core domain protein [Rhodococcus erythropolis]|nr:integrase core domain protein [Rhodococcus erythropolis]